MPGSGRQNTSRTAARSSLSDTILAFHERLKELRFATGSTHRVSPVEETSDPAEKTPPPEAIESDRKIVVDEDRHDRTPAQFQCRICLKHTVELVLYRDSPMCADCRDLLIYGRG